MRYVPEYEAHSMYDDMLNDCYEVVSICGGTYSPAYALKQVDETAYRCGFNDWCDSENITTSKNEVTDDE